MIEPIHGLYINIDRRTDRKLKMQKRLLSINADIERLSASTELEPPKGYIRSKAQYNCMVSHINAVKYAKEKGWDCFLLLEDDVIFADDFNERLEFLLATMPKEWHIFYLGCNYPVIQKEGIHNRLKRGFGAWSMLIHSRAYDSIIKLWEKGNDTCDDLLSFEYYPKNPCYVALPTLCYVENDYSDIDLKKRVVNFTRLNFQNKSQGFKQKLPTGIPKIIHQIWLGNKYKPPIEWMQTWKEKHPDWEYKLWTDEDVKNLPMKCRRAFDLQPKDYVYQSDVLRYEILFRYGGIFIDADSTCLKKIPDTMMMGEGFACWESETQRKGIIANGYLAARRGSRFMAQVLYHIALQNDRQLTCFKAWKTVGTKFISDLYNRLKPEFFKIYPSHYFIPMHFTGVKNGEPMYSEQYWGSSKNSYEMTDEFKEFMKTHKHVSNGYVYDVVQLKCKDCGMFYNK